MVTITVLPNYSPRIIVVDSPFTDITVQEVVNLCREWEEMPQNLSYTKLIAAAGKEDLGGSVSVGITATLQNAQLRFAARTVPLDTGSATTTESTGKLLTDTAATFVSDGFIYIGCTIFNSSTAEMETVLDFTENTITSLPISGNGSSGWTNTDTYSVYPNVQCSVSGGNLVAVDSVGDTISSIFQSPNTQVVRTSSSSATLQELGAIQYSSFNGGVTVDNVNGVSGTAYNIGTPGNPVNNLTDALIIAQAEGNGFTTFYIKENMTIDTGLDFSGIEFVGQSITKTTLTVDSSANVTKSEFYEASITGTLDGENKLKNCLLQTLNYVNGVVEECLLDDYTVTLGGGVDAYFLNCWSAVAGIGTPIIDMGTTGQNLGLRNYNGGLKIINMAGAGDNISLDLNSAKIILDSTSVTNGTVVCRGVGSLVDESDVPITTGTWNTNVTIVNLAIDGPTIAVAVNNEIGEEIQDSSFGGGITIDVINGISGTDYPIGNKANPVDNLIDAQTIAIAKGTKNLFIIGDLTIEASDVIDNYHLIGQGATFNVAETTITLTNGCSTSDTIFKNSKVLGVQGGESVYDNCVVDNLTNTHCEFINCKMVGPVQMVNSAWTDTHVTDLHNCRTRENWFVVDYNASPINQVYTNFNGKIKITNFSHVDGDILINMDAGEVWVDSSCTNGDITINGIGILTDESDGTTVVIDGLMSKETITKISWDVVHVDVDNGSAGIIFPLGTPSSPVDNITDAKTIAEANSINEFHVHGDITLTGDWGGYKFTSDSYETCTVTCTDVIFNHTIFENLEMVGNLTSGEMICNTVKFPSGFTNIHVDMENCQLIGTFTINPSGYISGDRCTSASLSTINVGGTGDLSMANFSGLMAITNATGGGVSIGITGTYIMTLDASCTAGTALIGGIGTLTDNSSMTVINKTLPYTTWEELTSAHQIDGTTGKVLAEAKENAELAFLTNP